MIYLDHHASAPLCTAALAAMQDALPGLHGNASSIHTAGRRVRARLEGVRTRFANAVGVQARELVFCSGGTEGMELLVGGHCEAVKPSLLLVDRAGHPCLLAASKRAADRWNVPLLDMPLKRGGLESTDELRNVLANHRPGALLVCTWVQHETGLIRDLRSLHEALLPYEGTMLVDGVQGLGKIPVDLPTLGAAGMAFSGHKIGAPAGVGIVWTTPKLRVVSQMQGGGQERGLRAGTENVLGIVGLGGALQELNARLADQDRLRGVRDGLERAVRAIPGLVVNGLEGPRVATVLHLSIRGLPSEELVAALDLEGFCVSSGPACSSGRPGPSPALLAMYPDESWRASGTLRVSIGPETKASDIEALASLLPELVTRLRR